MSTNEIQQRIEKDRVRVRRQALMLRVLDGLRSTVQLRPISSDGKADDVRMEFTDKSAEFIAPLVEAIEILEAIIFASDGCRGHRDCAHSMEPWQRARALLQGKWDAESECRPWPETPPRGVTGR